MSSTSSTATNLRLNGVSLPVARGVFLILSLAALVFFRLGIPEYYKDAVEDISPKTLATLSSLGMSAGFYSIYRTALLILLAVGCSLAVAIFISVGSDIFQTFFEKTDPSRGPKLIVVQIRMGILTSLRQLLRP